MREKIESPSGGLERAAGWAAVLWAALQPLLTGPATGAAVLFILCGFIARFRGRAARSPLLLPVLVFHAILLVATLVAPAPLAWLGGDAGRRAGAFEQLTSLRYYWNFWLLPACALWAPLGWAWFRRMWLAFAVSTLVAYATAFAELATQVNVRWDLLPPVGRALGLRFMDHGLDKLPENRAYGWFDHPLTFGGFLCVTAFTAAGIALHPGARRRLAAGLTTAVAAAGGVLLLIAKNRSYWLGLPAGVALLLRGRGRRALLAAAGAGALAFGGLLALSPVFRSRAGQLLSASSNAERTGFWKSGRDMFLARPLTGWGVWGYRVYGEPFREPYQPADHRFSNFTPVHCTYLQLLVEGGIPFLAAFVWVAAVIAKRLWRRGAGPGLAGALARGALAAFAAYLVAALFEMSIADKEAAVPLMMLLGAAVHLPGDEPGAA